MIVFLGLVLLDGSDGTPTQAAGVSVLVSGRCPVSALTIRFSGPSPLGPTADGGFGGSNLSESRKSTCSGRGGRVRSFIAVGVSPSDDIAGLFGNDSQLFLAWFCRVSPSVCPVGQRRVTGARGNTWTLSWVVSSGLVLVIYRAADPKGPIHIFRAESRTIASGSPLACATVSSIPTGIAPSMLPTSATGLPIGLSWNCTCSPGSQVPPILVLDPHPQQSVWQRQLGPGTPACSTTMSSGSRGEVTM